MSIKQVIKYTDYLKGKIDFTQHSTDILNQLVQLSRLYGKPLRFTSSFRTPYTNKLCNGSPNSSHLKGLAFDIICICSDSRYNLIKAINILGIKRYGVYKSHIHIDFDDTKVQNVTWYG